MRAKINAKKMLLIVLTVIIVLCSILCRFLFLSVNQYYPSAVECLEHRLNTKISSELFEYEGKTQGFYIVQNEDGDFIISVLKIKNFQNKKFYRFKLYSSSGSLYSLLADWSEIGDFEYFIAKDENTIIKYAGGKEPTYKESISYTVNGKEQYSVVYLIDKSL